MDTSSMSPVTILRNKSPTSHLYTILIEKKVDMEETTSLLKAMLTLTRQRVSILWVQHHQLLDCARHGHLLAMKEMM